ncbi:MAG: uridine kinase [Deltaproteobacteria bacterium]|nr:uridine kinase [Deltaproteobacteria bacterium]
MARSLIIGIAGGTGSGKTTVARKIQESLPPGASVILDHDSYYHDRSDLPQDEREKLNYDHPDALDNVALIRDLDTLRQGRDAQKPVYDFATHTRLATTEPVRPAPIILVEGILILVDEALRRRFDVKIFVDTDADIRVFRRIRRDMEKRGRSFASIRHQYYATVRPMHLQFVEPSKRWADLIIPEGGENRVALELIVGRLLNFLDQAGRSPSYS